MVKFVTISNPDTPREAVDTKAALIAANKMGVSYCEVSEGKNTRRFGKDEKGRWIYMGLGALRPFEVGSGVETHMKLVDMRRSDLGIM